MRGTRCHRRSTLLWKRTSSLILFVLILSTTSVFPQCLNLPRVAPVDASGIITDLVSSTIDRLFPPEDFIDDNFETKTLNIVEISDMRARDIKRRLARKHGYGADELSRMIDKKDLINTLSFEEHKAYLQEVDRRKWIRFKRTVIFTCLAVLIVMFWPLVRHALEVAHVNFVVYTGEFCSVELQPSPSCHNSKHNAMQNKRRSKETRDEKMP